MILKKYANKIICGITYEGIAECHDKKRRTINGSGSFALTDANIDYIKENYSSIVLNDKITFDRDTVSLIPSVIKALVKKGYLSVIISYDITTQINKVETEEYYKYLCEAID
jgi:sulfatase maturation enzyme AslB (radical SAM superfamily)